MGISFNVAFNKKVPPYDKLGGDCMALGANGERLDKVAKKHKLPTLAQFVCIDPEEIAEITGLDPEELGLPPIQWFDPEVGLAAVSALAAFLRENPKAISQADAVVADLEQVEQELTAAKKRKARFHFCYLD